MKISVWPNNAQPFAETCEIVQRCEGFGWHAAYFADHFMPNGPDAAPLRGDVAEALTTLAALAARTSSIRLGTLVASATYRHPAVLAKSLCTIDQASGGRAIVGLGAGWQVNEHEGYGIPLGTVTERVDRFSEYVAVVHSLLTVESTTFSGRYYQLRDAPCDPRPVQLRPEILLGVRGPRRTTRLAAQYATHWNAWTTPADLTELNAVLDRHCTELSRDPRTLERTTQAMVFLSTDQEWLARHRDHDPGAAMIVGTPDEVAHRLSEYAAAGCDEFILPTFNFGGLARALETLELFEREVHPQLA